MTNLSGHTIAFDLDGTLVETVGDIHAALNLVLAAEGAPAATLDDIIDEMRTSRESERAGRLIDTDEAASMEKKKQEGYF